MDDEWATSLLNYFLTAEVPLLQAISSLGSLLPGRFLHWSTSALSLATSMCSHACMRKGQNSLSRSCEEWQHPWCCPARSHANKSCQEELFDAILHRLIFWGPRKYRPYFRNCNPRSRRRVSHLRMFWPVKPHEPGHFNFLAVWLWKLTWWCEAKPGPRSGIRKFANESFFGDFRGLTTINTQDHAMSLQFHLAKLQHKESRTWLGWSCALDLWLPQSR